MRSENRSVVTLCCKRCLAQVLNRFQNTVTGAYSKFISVTSLPRDFQRNPTLGRAYADNYNQSYTSTALVFCSSEFTQLKWPFPQHVGNCVGISAAMDRLDRTGQAKMPSKKCRITTVVAFCAARHTVIVLPRKLSLSSFETCPSERSQATLRCDSDPVSRSFW